jgi:hypothetical protein
LNLSFSIFSGFGLTTCYFTSAELSPPPEPYDPEADPAMKAALETIKIAEEAVDEAVCWGLVLKCYESRTRQHKILNINVLRLLKHYLHRDLMSFGRRP